PQARCRARALDRGRRMDEGMRCAGAGDGGILLPERDHGIAPLRGIGPASAAARRPSRGAPDRPAPAQRAWDPDAGLAHDDPGALEGWSVAHEQGMRGEARGLTVRKTGPLPISPRVFTVREVSAKPQAE